MVDWWTAIEASLKPNGKLRIFVDNNQKVYSGERKIPKRFEGMPVDLKKNYRNTKSIHEAANVHYAGPTEILASGPDGLEVIWKTAKDTNAKIEASIDLLVKLLRKDKVAVGDVAVLFNSPATRSKFYQRLNERKVGLVTSNAEHFNPNAVVVETVRRFKGLERSAIILVVDGLERQSAEIAYVAFSRARAYLIVVSSKKDQEWLRGTVTL